LIPVSGGDLAARSIVNISQALQHDAAGGRLANLLLSNER
jgi:hypothetical protein